LLRQAVETAQRKNLPLAVIPFANEKIFYARQGFIEIEKTKAGPTIMALTTDKLAGWLKKHPVRKAQDDKEGHWVTIGGRPVFISGPRQAGPAKPKAAPVPPSPAWISPAPSRFITARNKSKLAAFMSPLMADDLKDSRIYMNEEGNVGVAVSSQGDITNVFNAGGPPNAGVHAVLKGLDEGGYTLDCYDGHLPDYYTQFGFVETGRMKFNREYAPKNWDYARFKEPDVVFMTWNGYGKDGREGVLSRFGPNPRGRIKNVKSTRYYQGDQWDQAKEDSRRASPYRPLGKSLWLHDRRGQEFGHCTGRSGGRSVELRRAGEIQSPLPGMTLPLFRRLGEIEKFFCATGEGGGIDPSCAGGGSRHVGHGPPDRSRALATEARYLPKSGFLRIAVRMPGGKIAVARANEKSHENISNRLKLSPEQIKGSTWGWVNTRGTFYNTDWVRELAGETWNKPEIKIPRMIPRSEILAGSKSRLIGKSFPDHAGRPGQVGGSLPRGESPGKDTFERTRDTAARTRLGGTITNSQRFGDTASNPSIITIENPDGTEERVFFKAENDAYYRSYCPPGEQTNREVAAYEVAKVMGLSNMQLGKTHLEVPVVIEREGPDNMGGIGRGAAIATADSGLKDAAYFSRSVERLSKEAIAECGAFDYMIGNVDRHQGNWRQNDDGTRVALIDHGLSFPDTPINVFSGFWSGVNPSAKLLGKHWSASYWDRIENAIRNAGLGDSVVTGVKDRFFRIVELKNQGGNLEDLA
jgi:hypothetical protein